MMCGQATPGVLEGNGPCRRASTAGGAGETLDGQLSVGAGGHTWTVTRAALGMTADVEGAVDRAFALAEETPFFSRVYHRVAEAPMDASFDAPFAYRRGRSP